MRRDKYRFENAVVLQEIWELNGEAGRSLLGVLLTSSACITLDKCRFMFANLCSFEQSVM